MLLARPHLHRASGVSNAGGVDHAVDRAETLPRRIGNPPRLRPAGDIALHHQNLSAVALHILHRTDLLGRSIVRVVAFQPGRPMIARGQTGASDQDQPRGLLLRQIARDLKADAAQAAKDQIYALTPQPRCSVFNRRIVNPLKRWKPARPIGQGNDIVRKPIGHFAQQRPDHGSRLQALLGGLLQVQAAAARAGVLHWDQFAHPKQRRFLGVGGEGLMVYALHAVGNSDDIPVSSGRAPPRDAWSTPSG